MSQALTIVLFQIVIDPKRVAQTDDAESQDGQDQSDEAEELEKCVIINHKTNKQGEVKVEVKWNDTSKVEWQFLYDMWADYPAEVIDYQSKNKNKCRGKIWKVPKIEDLTYFVRILGMLDEAKEVKEAEFIVLANNGYKFDSKESEGVKYHELERDDPELLQAYLGEMKDSSEIDDASLASTTVA